MSSTRQLSIAWNLYSQNFKNKSIPYYSDNDANSLWIGQLRSVFSKIDTNRLCVEATTSTGYTQSWGSAFGAWGPNGAGFLTNQMGSYAFNGFLYWFNTAGSRGPFYSTNPQDDGKFFHMPVRRSSEVPVFMDGAWPDVWINNTDQPPPNLTDASHTNMGQEMWRIALGRHGRAINIAYCDGHAETVPMEKLYNQRWHAMYTPPKPIPKFPLK